MTKSRIEKSPSAQPSEHIANRSDGFIASDSHAAAVDLSDEAVDVMLGRSSATARLPSDGKERQRNQMAHDAAWEAARDGDCAGEEAHQHHPYHSHRSDIVDPWIESP